MQSVIPPPPGRAAHFPFDLSNPLAPRGPRSPGVQPPPSPAASTPKGASPPAARDTTSPQNDRARPGTPVDAWMREVADDGASMLLLDAALAALSQLSLEEHREAAAKRGAATAAAPQPPLGLAKGAGPCAHPPDGPPPMARRPFASLPPMTLEASAAPVARSRAATLPERNGAAAAGAPPWVSYLAAPLQPSSSALGLYFGAQAPPLPSAGVPAAARTRPAPDDEAAADAALGARATKRRRSGD